VGPRGKGRRDERGKGGKAVEERGREGRESRNAQIQSWQAETYQVCFLMYEEKMPGQQH